MCGFRGIGAVSGFIFRKKKSKPTSQFVIMATTKNSEIKALNPGSTKVVKAKEKKNRMSRKTKNLTESMETDNVKGSFLRKMEKYSKVKESFAIPWGDTHFQVSPEEYTSALPAEDMETVKTVTEDDTMTELGAAGHGPSQSELFNDGESVNSDVSSDGTTDSNQNYERESRKFA
ncbi:hypothetical protein AVEN_78609-1 [Araneus ventricosus]|uniref:Uncharacterized protein n=1 Tax=Araneus ventricosus TaxID=182803 RepID=A0A4Y2FZM8_ARAVE|nr:hypothetical protein AVEN_78609-1 [Araneus ventricosus]